MALFQDSRPLQDVEYRRGVIRLLFLKDKASLCPLSAEEIRCQGERGVERVEAGRPLRRLSVTIQGTGQRLSLGWDW